MMQIVPGHATADRRMINPVPVRLGEAERVPLTPAERIALTIALLNCGLDLMDEFARTSLQACRPGRSGVVTTLSRSATPRGRLTAYEVRRGETPGSGASPAPTTSTPVLREHWRWTPILGSWCSIR